MKLIITPRRHAVPVKPGDPILTEEGQLAAIARGRHEMVMKLMKRFPQAKILGIEGSSEILVELPDDAHGLKDRIRAELDVETGPAERDPQMPIWRTDIGPRSEVIAAAHADKEYRPTIVALVRDGTGRVLLVQSRFDPDEWMFVQGGIEEGEDPLTALAREIREELDVGADFFSPTRYVGTADLDVEEGRADKRGFAKGKRYFIYEVAYRGLGELRVQASEIADYAWVEPRFDDAGGPVSLLSLIARVRPGKQALLIGAVLNIL